MPASRLSKMPRRWVFVSQPLQAASGKVRIFQYAPCSTPTMSARTPHLTVSARPTDAIIAQTSRMILQNDSAPAKDASDAPADNPSRDNARSISKMRIIETDGPACAKGAQSGQTRPPGGLLWRCLVAVGRSVLDGLSEFGRCHQGGHVDQPRR